MHTFKYIIACAVVLTLEATAIEIQGWDEAVSLELQPFYVQTIMVPMKTIFVAQYDVAVETALQKVDIKTVAKPLQTLYFCRYDNFLLIDLVSLIP